MRVLLVDDHPLFAEGVARILTDAGMQAHVALNGQAGLALLDAEPNAWDLILMDLSMPEMDGIEMLKVMGERQHTVPAVVISATEDLHSIALALRHGAFGFIPKYYNKQEILNAVQQVVAGDVYLPGDLRPAIERIDDKELDKHDADQRKVLTRRQMEVLLLMRDGMSNKKMAQTMFLSLSTVKFHIAALFELLGAANRTDCIGKAISRGLIE